MQFLILAYDGTDADAITRRMQAREAHLAHVVNYKAKGHLKMGAALLDAGGKMIGSTLIVDFPTREAMEAWLDSDPYVLGGVWQDVQVIPCQIAPSFVDK